MSYQPDWQDTLKQVLREHNKFKANGKTVAAYATQQRRAEILWKGFRDLRKMGFKFTTVYGLRGKHIEYLVKHWEQSGLSASSLQLNISTFRTFANWLGKQGMVRRLEFYVESRDRALRQYAATESKSWSGQGINVMEKIETLRNDDTRIADVLLLQLHFGLRSKEALLLRPHVADQGDTLLVVKGTKGGRNRYVPIETPEQRQLLDHIKSYTQLKESLVPTNTLYKNYHAHYYYVLKKNGISRANGIVAHGLRHQYLNALYKKVTGHHTPLEGGQLPRLNAALDSYGRQIVAEQAGHGRETISAAYVGSKTTSTP